MALIYASSRGVFAPTDLAFATAVQPSLSAWGDGGHVKGLPRRLMATPQWVIAHVGSNSLALENAFMAGANQKECSSATARSNCACAAALQETAKCTWPSCSPG